jgi:hypothetical protein
MIPAAPHDFWTQVIEKVAKLIWQREVNGIPPKTLICESPPEKQKETPQ